MRLKRHETEVFSMSFLDCICCGFGAMILILVITETGQPVILEKTRIDTQGTVAKLQEELHVIRGETDVLNREMRGRVEQLSKERDRLARLQGDLSMIKANSRQPEGRLSRTPESELVAAYQKLTAEMERLMKSAIAVRRATRWWHSGRQRVHHFSPILGHAGVQLAGRAPDAERDPRHVPAGQGHSDHG
jgi:hypothetical protein